MFCVRLLFPHAYSLTPNLYWSWVSFGIRKICRTFKHWGFVVFNISGLGQWERSEPLWRSYLHAGLQKPCQHLGCTWSPSPLFHPRGDPGCPQWRHPFVSFSEKPHRCGWVPNLHRNRNYIKGISDGTLPAGIQWTLLWVLRIHVPEFPNTDELAHCPSTVLIVGPVQSRESQLPNSDRMGHFTSLQLK